jgi:uncharacterized protein YigA (DUF484 family)
MSKQTARGIDAVAIDDDRIAEYLVANPDFFERHAGVLARLRLPHQRGSAAVSLVERQVLVLREKLATVEARLYELIENGRTNDATTDRMHRLTRRLIRTRDLPGVVTALETSLREDFGASRWVALITNPSLPGIAGFANQHLRVVPRASSELRIFEAFFESARPRSGQIRDTQREYLFGGEGSTVGSSALIPLGDRASLGLLAIGSHDTERFLPTMSTDFLVRIGELVSEAMLARTA